MFHIHILPSHSQGPQGSFLSSDLLVLQSPTSPLGLPGAAPVRTSNPAWHRITRPASLGFPAAVLAPPSWPGPGEAGQLQESSEAIRSFVQWRQEGTYQRSKSVLLSTQEKREVGTQWFLRAFIRSGSGQEKILSSKLKCEAKFNIYCHL